MRYIDANRLKVEIEKLIKEVKDAAEKFTPNMGFFDAKLSGIHDVMAIIASLQQEPSCDTCTNDKGCVTCKDGELWEGKEQPSEDLEEEMDRFFEEMPVQEQENIFEDTYQMIARHFANWQKQQMLKEAVEGKVRVSKTMRWMYPVGTDDVDKTLRRFQDGDSVKIIIVKEDKE